MASLSEHKKILITVRTYPTPATKGVEVSCTGGITEDGKWMRLFPMPYRFLRPDQQFHKYQWIEAKIIKASSDARPESYHIDRDSIKIASETLSTTNAWQKRKELINKLKGHCLCCIKKERDKNGFPTLGIFKPKTIAGLDSTLAIQESTLCRSGKGGQAPSGNWVKSGGEVDITKLPGLPYRCNKALIWLPFPCYLVAAKMAKVELDIEPDDPTWTNEQLEKLRQGDFLENAPAVEVEKIPYKFRYSFRCDHVECPGHTAICTDWEMGESYRKWRNTYGDGWESKFRERYESEMTNKYDTHFYVGTIHGHPHIWIIVGLFYPPFPKLSTTLPLFG